MTAAGKPVIAFGDFSYYNIGDRSVRSFAELKEVFAGNGMVGFVAGTLIMFYDSYFAMQHSVA